MKRRNLRNWKMGKCVNDGSSIPGKFTSWWRRLIEASLSFLFVFLSSLYIFFSLLSVSLHINLLFSCFLTAFSLSVHLSLRVRLFFSLFLSFLSHVMLIFSLSVCLSTCFWGVCCLFQYKKCEESAHGDILTCLTSPTTNELHVLTYSFFACIYSIRSTKLESFEGSTSWNNSLLRLGLDSNCDTLVWKASDWPKLSILFLLCHILTLL